METRAEMEPNLPGSGAPTPPRTPCGGSSRGEEGAASAGGASPLSSSPPRIVAGFEGVPSSAGERAAARRRKAPGKPADSPLATLLRSRNTSFPSLPALKTKRATEEDPRTLSLASCHRQTLTPPPPSGVATPCSAMDASPCSSDSRRRRDRSYSDLTSGCSTPLSRSSDPISIPPARMAALLGHEASLMEELSSAESGGGGGGRLGLPPTTPASAAAVARRRAESAAVGATAMMNSAASFSAATNAAANANRSSLCGSLRDIQQLMDEQGQAGAARLLAELAAAQAERDALASDAAALKAAAERAEEGSCCCRSDRGGGGGDGGGGGKFGQAQQQEELLLPQLRPPSAASPPPAPQATFLFDDLDLGPPAAAGSGSRDASVVF